MSCYVHGFELHPDKESCVIAFINRRFLNYPLNIYAIITPLCTTETDYELLDYKTFYLKNEEIKQRIFEKLENNEYECYFMKLQTNL